MLVGVMFARLFGMMDGLNVVPMGDVCMVTGCFMVGRVVVFGCQAMMLGSMFVMLSGLAMMICGLLGHEWLKPRWLG